MIRKLSNYGRRKGTLSSLQAQAFSARYRKQVTRMSIPYRGPLARGTDRSTGHAAAQDGRGPRAGSQRLRLLREYGKHPLTGLTAYEAASVAGLLDVGYWKRVSDLFNDGLIEPTGEE